MTQAGFGAPPRSRFDRRLALHAPPLLARFNEAEILEPVDVHAAVAVGRLLGEERPPVLLAAALAVRGTRSGHVRIHLPTVRDTIVVDGVVPDAVEALWPEPAAWRAALASSPLCGAGEATRPLVLSGDYVYLQRYWDHEQRLAASLRRRAEAPLLPADGHASWLARFFEDDRQRLAAAMAATQRLTVITGGPGTGKTRTVALLVAALLSAADESGTAPPAVALAAPTGKAADRLTEKLHEEAARLANAHQVTKEVANRLLEIEGSTIHRLLGAGLSRGPFRHGPDNPLPHDVVVVDEMSMVSLPLARKLLGAIHSEARLVLVGDHRQLVSIEAGTVLADVVGPASGGLRLSDSRREQLKPLVGALPSGPADQGPGFGDCVVPLVKNYRQDKGTGIPELIEAIRLEPPSPDAVIEVLRRRAWPHLTWLDTEVETPEQMLQMPELAAVVARARELAQFGAAGDVAAALGSMQKLAVLCPHRHGPTGGRDWVAAIERLAGVGGRWYPGRPVMVTANDYTLGLFNGDIGVTVHEHGKPVVYFPGPKGPRSFGPARLENIQTVHAMTIHKSQGSEYPRVIVVLPAAGSRLLAAPSRLLTQELLYTAVSRVKVVETPPGHAADSRASRAPALIIVGTEAAIRYAVEHPVERASGLRELLWGAPEDESSAR